MATQILLFTQPRSGSHLIERMLEGQSKCTPFLRLFEDGWHRQIVEWLRTDSYSDGIPPDARIKYEDEMKNGIRDWQDARRKALETGKELMIHTHSFFPASTDNILQRIQNPESAHSTGENFTLIPDNVLLDGTVVPILTIRNPRLAVPSAYRAMQAVIQDGRRPNMILVTCPIWTRLLYDYFLRNNVQPIVIDADDYMTSESFVWKLCSKAGLDPNEATLSWSTTSDEEKGGLKQPYVAVQTTLMGSTGANPGRAAKNLDLQAEEAKWEEEFGENLPLVQELVRIALPHYDYLYERRLRE